jgi:hypothetical protein
LPAEHDAVPLAPLQTLPHPPQSEVLALTFVSQPLPTFASQFAKPALQAIAQAHEEQLGVPFALLQTTLQPPHEVTPLAVFVSQPSAGFALQSAKPVLHASTAHAPVENVPTAFCGVHPTPHAPQLVVVRTLVSQPLGYRPSQSANPAVHVSTEHVVPVHFAVPFAAEHAAPHAPQAATLPVMAVSQPFVALPSQSAEPPGQLATPQTPATQFGVAPPTAGQTLPHVAQLRASTSGFTSQPFATLASQSR